MAFWSIKSGSKLEFQPWKIQVPFPFLSTSIKYMTSTSIAHCLGDIPLVWSAAPRTKPTIWYLQVRRARRRVGAKGKGKSKSKSKKEGKLPCTSWVFRILSRLHTSWLLVILGNYPAHVRLIQLVSGGMMQVVLSMS